MKQPVQFRSNLRNILQQARLAINHPNLINARIMMRHLFEDVYLQISSRLKKKL